MSRVHSGRHNTPIARSTGCRTLRSWSGWICGRNAWIDLRGARHDHASVDEPKRGDDDNERVGKRPSVFARVGNTAVAFFAGVTTVVVAIGGVLTLVRDEASSGAAKPESSRRAAPLIEPTPNYQQRIADLCDTSNRDAREVARRNRTLRIRLAGAHTASVRRKVLLNDQRRALDLSEDRRSRLDALEPPAALAVKHARTAAVWKQQAGLQRRYAQRLDGVRGARDLEAAVALLSRLRPLLEARQAAIREGMLYLAQGLCRLAVRSLPRR